MLCGHEGNRGLGGKYRPNGSLAGFTTISHLRDQLNTASPTLQYKPLSIVLLLL